jgi:hypothetical protein
MKTLEQFLVGLTPMQVMLVGQIVTAHETRAWFRTKFKVAEADHADAERTRCGSWLAEVGDHYDSVARERECVKLHAGSTVKSMDKFYKKKKHQFIDAGGTSTQVDELVGILTKSTEPKK